MDFFKKEDIEEENANGAEEEEIEDGNEEDSKIETLKTSLIRHHELYEKYMLNLFFQQKEVNKKIALMYYGKFYEEYKDTTLKFLKDFVLDEVRVKNTKGAPECRFFKKYEIELLFGVFRKLHQPAAPHPGYSISEDQRDGDIQALLGTAEKSGDTHSRYTVKYFYIDNIEKIKENLLLYRSSVSVDLSVKKEEAKKQCLMDLCKIIFEKSSKYLSYEYK